MSRLCISEALIELGREMVIRRAKICAKDPDCVGKQYMIQSPETESDYT